MINLDDCFRKGLLRNVEPSSGKSKASVSEATGIHYAGAVLRIQSVLYHVFGKEIMVTTRSFNTLNGLMHKIYELDYQNM